MFFLICVFVRDMQAHRKPGANSKHLKHLSLQFSAFLFKTVSLAEPGTQHFSELAGQAASGILQTLFSQCWSQHMPAHLDSTLLGIQAQIIEFVQQVFYSLSDLPGPHCGANVYFPGGKQYWECFLPLPMILFIHFSDSSLQKRLFKLFAHFQQSKAHP